MSFIKKLAFILSFGLFFAFSTSAHAGKKHYKNQYHSKYNKKHYKKHRHGGGDDNANQPPVNMIDNGVKRDCRQIGNNLICN